jgi:phenylacetic acid degradation operon negative regulatory protein
MQGEMQVIVIAPAADEPAALRALLKAAGFAAVSPVIHVGFGALPKGLAGRRGVFMMTPRAEDRLALATEAFRLDEVSQGYRDFVAQFTPLAAALDRGAPSEEEALITRTLLIHGFRRIVLRDPGLPDAMLPPDWSGGAARALAGTIYKRLAAPSEAFLDAHGRNETGPLPKPRQDLALRFSAGLSTG